MGSVKHGAQWASRQTVTVTPLPAPAASSSASTLIRRGTVILLLLLIAFGAVAGISSPKAIAASSDVLMPRSELMTLPTSGAAWTALKSVADASLPAPDLCDQNSDHHLRTLAAALVYARTGIASYGSKARAAIMAALPTQKAGCTNAVLALGRQLAAYVFAADLADLSGTDDTTFRSWLSAIRTKNIGGHPTWNSLVGTHLNSPNNWGAYAGASRIAADIYLGDTTDLASAAKVTRGFLGDKTAYAGFTQNLMSDAVSWTCSGSVSDYTPTDAGCTRNGINLDGAVAADISRGGTLRWPPADPGIPYQLEAIQGLGLQVELLSRHGYSDAWSWSGSALKRMAAVVSRSAASGGTGWNDTHASRQMPWLLNLRYGTSIPTQSPGMGRAIGFTDWLYGTRSGSGTGPVTTPAPTPKPTSTPTATPTPTPSPKPTPTPTGTPTSAPTSAPGATATPVATATPATTPTPTPRPTPTPTPPPSGGSSGSAPAVSTPTAAVRAAYTSTGVAAVVHWSLVSSSDGLARYELQRSVDGGSWTSVGLSSATTTSLATTAASGHSYRYRVRAVDRSGLVGSWKTSSTVHASLVNDSSPAISWHGTWGTAGYSAYIGGSAHYSRTAGATATFKFTGSGIVLLGPKGPGRGKSTISIDGKVVATIDQYASSFAANRLLFARSLSAGTHTITIKVLGTSGRPMVAIDALGVLAVG